MKSSLLRSFLIFDALYISWLPLLNQEIKFDQPDFQRQPSQQPTGKDFRCRAQEFGTPGHSAELACAATLTITVRLNQHRDMNKK